jgi:hypothetical protein
MAGMDLAAMFSRTGRVKPGPFTLAILFVYLLGFMSQLLMSNQHGKLLAFTVVQGGLLWAWYALHASRLRDAGRSTGSAFGVAIVYGLSVLLIILMVWFLAGPSGNSPTGTKGDELLAGMLLLALLGMFYGAFDLGSFGLVIALLVLIALAPALIAIGFTIWAATRRSVTPPAPATLPAPGS